MKNKNEINKFKYRHDILKKGMNMNQHEHDSCGVGFIVNIKGNKTHELIQNALEILLNLEHRGAVGADPLLSDGAGILVQIPDKLYQEEMLKQGVELPPIGEYGVGMIFLPQETAARIACEKELERTVRAEGQEVLGWRNVPLDHNMPMSPVVKSNKPVIRQIFIGKGKNINVADALERKLYVIRKSASHNIKNLNLAHSKEYFVASMSAKTVVYKGMLLPEQVATYYLDLADPRMVTALALVHQRFSTNTFPSWELAHPYRLIAHNGEINTVKGNFNWLRAREAVLSSPVIGKDIKKLWPLIYEGQSDTACFDNCLELLIMAGYPLAHAVMMMIPEAWEQHQLMDENRRAFYEYHSAMMEPWDGPAAIAFTDGKQIGATLDRNGLRPARYCITNDNQLIMASEVGVLPIPEEKIVKKWRLQPGRMLLVDTEVGRLIDDDELKNLYSQSRPYREWIDRIRVRIDDLPNNTQTQYKSKKTEFDHQLFIKKQIAFGYTQEDIKFLMQPMVVNGEEPIGSMGNDSALSVLSNHNKPFYNYFKQLFAQVTNPPIDPIRENLVMSLISYIGPRPNLLDIYGINPPSRLQISQPILTIDEMNIIHNIENISLGRFKSYVLDICFPKQWGSRGVEAHLASLCAEAIDAIQNHANILIISDKNLNQDFVAIPALLASSALHQFLIRKGFRANAGIVVETGSAREVHHFAVLGGFGAEAVHPYIAFNILEQIHNQMPSVIQKEFTLKHAYKNYVKAINKGLFKVFSKMGISTFMSYCGAQIFEAVGLEQSLLDQHFSGLTSKIGGMGIFEIAEESIRQHQIAFPENHQKPQSIAVLENGGEYAYRADGEEHMWTPDSIANLQHAVRGKKVDCYENYAKLINEQGSKLKTLRGLFKIKYANQPIPIDEVESAKEIVKRFATGAMSLGSISTEAHSTLAVAMNRLGGKSNTGEGGEDPVRYVKEMIGKDAGKKIDKDQSLASILGESRVVVDYPLQEGDSLRSRIKQVASGRFGVTAQYLVSADEIQIKMAQGAKPGEGGQLPGHKVSEYIGFMRYSVPGVGLISPPPHHDIYSIEDLKQLIYDLKNVNPNADISVKLVSEVGVGTVAAGVSKCKADHITISGFDGGTGASPLSSIKHAGTPWELGLSETQQVLVMNDLRSRVRLQVDGQIKTGRDVVIGAMLGADEFGFSTAPLVAEGCVMMRKCHLNTCPVGIATQDPILRKRFNGRPEHVVNYFFFVAEEVRQIMSKIGVKTFNQLIGRSDLLDMRESIEHWKSQNLDFSKVFYYPDYTKGKSSFFDSDGENQNLRSSQKQDHELEKTLDKKIIKSTLPAINKGLSVKNKYKIKNINRSVGAMLSGAITRIYGSQGLAEGKINLTFDGTAGQSFGAYLTTGIIFKLFGQTNDYMGKGLSGGIIIVDQSPKSKLVAKDNIIVGNTSLYGATNGFAFINGVGGERFAVRNSGATAVIEGVGDHGCEYMTGGVIVVLGKTGRNFAAGMSGGVAYVYDPNQEFKIRCNLEMVDLIKLIPDNLDKVSHIKDQRVYHLGYGDQKLLFELINKQAKYTTSLVAEKIIKNWQQEKQNFVKVMPKEYRRALIDLFGLKPAKTKSVKSEKIAI